MPLAPKLDGHGLAIGQNRDTQDDRKVRGPKYQCLGSKSLFDNMLPPACRSEYAALFFEKRVVLKCQR